MAVKMFSGFEGGEASGVLEPGFTSYSGVVSSATQTHTGNYSLRINPADGITTQYGQMSCPNGAGAVDGYLGAGYHFSTRNLWISFYLYIATPPSSDSEQIMHLTVSGLASRISMRLDSVRKLSLYDSTDSLLGTTVDALAAGVWHRIEVSENSTAGTYELRVAGISVLSGNYAWGIGDIWSVWWGKHVNKHSKGYDIYIDDVCICDDAFITQPSFTEVLVATGNGTYTDWIHGAGNLGDPLYMYLDELPYNNTDYLKTGGVDSRSTFTFANSATGGTIAAVRLYSTVKRAYGGDQVKYCSYSGSTLTTAANWHPLAVPYYGNHNILLLDPDTSAAWTLAGINALEGGFLGGALANWTKWTAIQLHVLFAGAAAEGRRMIASDLCCTV